MYDQPPAMKQRRPPVIPGGSPGPTPDPNNNIGQAAPPIRQPPQMIGGGPGPTGVGGYPANDLPSGPMGVSTHMNRMPPRTGGSGGPAFGGPPLQAGMPPRITRPPIGMPGGGPGPTPFGPPQFGGGPGLGVNQGAGGFGIAPGGPGEGGPGPSLAPGLPGGPGGNPYMQPNAQTASPIKPHYDTSMPDEWRRQRQRQALGQEQ